jgi:sulfite reductase beta subunit-like hemoprotein
MDTLSSNVVGLDIYNSQNDKIGKIQDIAFDASKQLTGYILSVGGFLGMGTHYVAVNPSSLNVSYDASYKVWRATMNATKTSSRRRRNSSTAASGRRAGAELRVGDGPQGLGLEARASARPSRQSDALSLTPGSCRLGLARGGDDAVERDVATMVAVDYEAFRAPLALDLALESLRNLPRQCAAKPFA